MCVCVFSEGRLSVEGAATVQMTVQRRMSSRSFGMLACCLEAFCLKPVWSVESDERKYSFFQSL